MCPHNSHSHSHISNHSHNHNYSHNHPHSHKNNNLYHSHNHFHSMCNVHDSHSLHQGQELPEDFHFHHDYHNEHLSMEPHKHSKIDIYICKSYDYTPDSFKSQNHIFYIVDSANYSQRIQLPFYHIIPDELLASIYHKIIPSRRHKPLCSLPLSLWLLHNSTWDITWNLGLLKPTEIDEFFCSFFEYQLVNFWRKVQLCP